MHKLEYRIAVNIRVGKSGQTVYTQNQTALEVRVYTICHSITTFHTPYQLVIRTLGQQVRCQRS